jgi:hypothetical protein
MIEGLLEKEAAHPLEEMRNQARYTMALRELNQRLGLPGDAIDPAALANNPEYFAGLRAAHDQHLGGLGSTAAERAPKVVSVAK